MKLIELWCCKKVVAATVVDNKYYSAVMEHAGPVSGHWNVMCAPNGTPYARRIIKVHGKCKSLWLHRLILELAGVPIPEGMEPDHINRDTLDNRLENLRVVTHQENISNQRPRSARRPSKPHPRHNATYCKRGHPFELFGRINSQGQKVCVLCHRLATERSYNKVGRETRRLRRAWRKLQPAIWAQLPDLPQPDISPAQGESVGMARRASSGYASELCAESIEDGETVRVRGDVTS
jgi:hypothetical protein